MPAPQCFAADCVLYPMSAAPLPRVCPKQLQPPRLSPPPSNKPLTLLDLLCWSC